MNISGRNLKLVSRALELAIDSLHQEIAMSNGCINEEEVIQELEAEQADLRKMAKRVTLAMEKEMG